MPALDPAGPIAAACGITWTLMMPTSGVSAAVAAVLCPFRRTAKQANRLSKVAGWSGLLALIAVLVGTLGTTDVLESRPRTRAARVRWLDSIFFVAATALPPLVGFMAGRISGRKIEVNRGAMLQGWKRTYEALPLVLPGVRPNPGSFLTPATIFEIADLNSVVVESGVIPRWQEHDCGPGLYSKIELFDRIFANAPIPEGDVIVITDQCFPVSDREPFFCHGETLRQWVADHKLFIFDGDVLFIWVEARRISVFHHEGLFAHIRAGKPLERIVNA